MFILKKNYLYQEFPLKLQVLEIEFQEALVGYRPKLTICQDVQGVFQDKPSN